MLCLKGCGVLSSSMLHGMVFKKEAEGDVASVKDAKIAVYSCPFDCTVTETKVKHREVSSLVLCSTSRWSNQIVQLHCVCLTGYCADSQRKRADELQQGGGGSDGGSGEGHQRGRCQRGCDRWEGGRHGAALCQQVWADGGEVRVLPFYCLLFVAGTQPVSLIFYFDYFILVSACLQYLHCCIFFLSWKFWNVNSVRIMNE